jgi:hypothetical protein
MTNAPCSLAPMRNEFHPLAMLNELRARKVSRSFSYAVGFVADLQVTRVGLHDLMPGVLLGAGSLEKQFEPITALIHNSVAQGGRVLVYHTQPTLRAAAAAMVLAYYMRYHVMTLDEALEAAQRAQPHTSFALDNHLVELLRAYHRRDCLCFDSIHQRFVQAFAEQLEMRELTGGELSATVPGALAHEGLTVAVTEIQRRWHAVVTKYVADYWRYLPGSRPPEGLLRTAIDTRAKRTAKEAEGRRFAGLCVVARAATTHPTVPL